MANTLAQNPTFASFGAASTVNKAFASGGTNPSLYVASMSWESSTITCTVADDRNAGNYTQDILKTSGSGSVPGRSSIYSIQNTSTSIATVTATLSGSTYGVLKTYELTGAATSSALDSSGGGNTITENVEAYSGSITTLSANCTVIMCSHHYPGDASADTNYTAGFTQFAGNIGYHFGEYRVDAGAAGGITLTAAYTGGTPVGFSMAIAAYKTFVAGPGNILMGQVCT